MTNLAISLKDVLQQHLTL